MSFNGVYIFHLSIGVNEAAEQTIIPSSWRPIHAFDAVSYSRSFILYIKLKFPHQSRPRLDQASLCTETRTTFDTSLNSPTAKLRLKKDVAFQH